MSSHEHWERVYREHDLDDLSWTQDEPTTSLDLLSETKVGPGAAIVDVGGGASTLVDHLLARGHRDITVVDVAEAGLERARARLAERAHGVRWVVGDVTQLDLGRPFHVWHDRAVLHFLTTREEQWAYRHALERHVRPGGHVLLATFAIDGPEQCSGLPVQRYDAQGLAAMAGPSFELVEARTEDHRTPWGDVQRFQWVRLRRRFG